MLGLLRTLGWLACGVYSTIPAFWLVVHGRADYWRSQRRSPYLVLVPLWTGMWVVVAIITVHWRHVGFSHTAWSWLPAIVLFALGAWLYGMSGANFSLQKLSGVPELRAEPSEQLLVTSGIHGHLRHPVYLAHLCEMLAWSVGTGLVVCYGLTVFAVVTGAVMIRIEDAELERRFGSEFRRYKASTPALSPNLRTMASRSNANSFRITLAGVAGLLIASMVLFAYAYAVRDQLMLFQHGTPEVPGGRAIVIMNPFRNRTSEDTAEKLIQDLRTSECEKIISRFSADERICPVLRQDREADLIFRQDRESSRLLVYDLPESRSRFWILFVREEGGFAVRSVSLIR